MLQHFLLLDCELLANCCYLPDAATFVAALPAKLIAAECIVPHKILQVNKNFGHLADNSFGKLPFFVRTGRASGERPLFRAFLKMN